MTKDEEPVVFIIDDDAQLRDSLGDLLRSIGLRVRAFGSAQEFLQWKHRELTGLSCA